MDCYDVSASSVIRSDACLNGGCLGCGFSIGAPVSPQWFFGASSRLLEVRPVIPCIEVRVYIERDADASVPTLTRSRLFGQGRSRGCLLGLHSGRESRDVDVVPRLIFVLNDL
jgi:hypothetical protein